MKKIYVCILMLLVSVCTFAQSHKKTNQGVLIEPVKSLPYDYYSIKGTMIKIALPLRYHAQQGVFERYTITVSNSYGKENAINILCRILSEIPSYYMETLDGFSSTDTIPPNTEAFICTEDRSFRATVDSIVKRLPLSLVGQCSVSVKKIQDKEKGKFIVMNPEDMKNILRIVKALPQDILKIREPSDGDSTPHAAIIIHTTSSWWVTDIKSHTDDRKGWMTMYYSLGSIPEEKIEDALAVIKAAMPINPEGAQPTVSRYIP